VGAVGGADAVAADHRPDQASEVVDQSRPRCLVPGRRRCDQSCNPFRFVAFHERNISNWTRQRIGGTPYFAGRALPSSASDARLARGTRRMGEDLRLEVRPSEGMAVIRAAVSRFSRLYARPAPNLRAD